MSLSLPLQAWGGELDVAYSSNLAVAFVVIFSVAMIVIGIVAGRYQTDEEEYYAAGRRSGLFVIGLSIFASIQSGWGLIGLPGSTYAIGFEMLAIGAGLVGIGFFITYWLLGRKMRTLGAYKNAITAPDAMYYRFGEDDNVRLLGAIAVFLGCMGYLASQYAALGLVGALVLPVGFFEALFLGLLVVGFYTAIGGILAALWSDAIQGIIMALGGAAASYYIFTALGGIGNTIDILASEGPQYLAFTSMGESGVLPIGFVLLYPILTVTTAAQPQATTKFYMVRRTALLKWGAIVSVTGYLLTTMYWWSGPVMQAAVLDGQVAAIPNPDAAMPIAMIEFAPPIVTALVLTSVIAAVMSTSNAFLNMGAAAVVHDTIQEYFGYNLSSKEQVRYGRITTVIILVGAAAIAASFPGLIFVLGAAGWAIFASVLFPGVALAYNWKGATKEGIMAGGGIGLALTLFLAYAAEYYALSLPLGMDLLAGQAANVVGFVVFIAVSYITSTAEFDDLDDPEIRACITMGRVKGAIRGPTPQEEEPTAVADGGESSRSAD